MPALSTQPPGRRTHTASRATPRLAQSGSLTLGNQTLGPQGQSYTPVARVVALIDSNGNVNSTTGLYNVFSQNNPRGAYTADGTNIYVSGQGNGPTQLTSSNNAGSPTAITSTGKLVITTGETNGINNSVVGGTNTINLSPEGFFFANSTTMYVADSGNGKQNSATSALGDGGLQKWSLINGTWVLDYTLATGLSLVANPARQFERYRRPPLALL